MRCRLGLRIRNIYFPPTAYGEPVCGGCLTEREKALVQR
jgi:hypothetical protein